MSDSVRPHRRQPTSLHRPWDSPGKNTGVSCHFLFQCMKVKSKSEVVQSCPTLYNPMDCSRVLEWGAITAPSVQLRSVTQSCPTLCDPMNRSTPGLPVYHKLPEFTQTYVHQVGDVIQPSHPLSSLSLPSSNPSQHQGLFQ